MNNYTGSCCNGSLHPKQRMSKISDLINIKLYNIYMKKWLFGSGILVLLFVACKKDKTSACTYTESSAVATTEEKDSLRNYLTHQGITTFTEDASGAFYTTDSLGTGGVPATLCTNMTVNYKGYLLNKPTPFDSTYAETNTVFQLGGLVVGWQKVMKQVHAGSKVTIYIPPTLGYGETIKRNGDGDTIIPKNSYLKFNVKLISNQ